MRGITYKDAGTRAMIDFQVVSLNKGKHLAANFTEMEQGRNATHPEFVWHLSI
jgi:hypothetical protein